MLLENGTILTVKRTYSR